MTVGMGRALFDRIRLDSCEGPHQRSSVLALSSQLPHCTVACEPSRRTSSPSSGSATRGDVQRELRAIAGRVGGPATQLGVFAPERVEVTQQRRVHRRSASDRTSRPRARPVSVGVEARTARAPARPITAAFVAKCGLGVRRSRIRTAGARHRPLVHRQPDDFRIVEQQQVVAQHDVARLEPAGIRSRRRRAERTASRSANRRPPARGIARPSGPPLRQSIEQRLQHGCVCPTAPSGSRTSGNTSSHIFFPSSTPH